MSEEIKLLPCPFCGSPGWWKCKPTFWSGPTWTVECSHCFATFQYGETEPEKAADKWNRRAPTKPKPCTFCGSTGNAPDSLKCDECGRDL